MSGTLGSVTEDPPFRTIEQATSVQVGVFRCRVDMDKQAVTRCFLLAADNVWGTNSLNLYDLLVHAGAVWLVQRKHGTFLLVHHPFDHCPPRWLLSGPRHPTHVVDYEVLQQGSHLTYRISGICLAVGSFTAFSPNVWHMQRLDVRADMSTLMIYNVMLFGLPIEARVSRFHPLDHVRRIST